MGSVLPFAKRGNYGDRIVTQLVLEYSSAPTRRDKERVRQKYLIMRFGIYEACGQKVVDALDTVLGVSPRKTWFVRFGDWFQNTFFPFGP